MTAKQLRDALNEYPDNMEVFMQKSNDEFELTLVNEVSKKYVPFRDGKMNARAHVIVLEDI